jgi:hypothetical protein
MSGDEPTPTALAAKQFLACVDNETYRQVIETRAILGGWVGARGTGLWDVKVSDAVVKGALDALWDLFRGWAAETDEDRIAARAATTERQ